MTEETLISPWSQMEGEPDVWYRIFRDYYLPLGTTRSLRNAFEFYLRAERPADYEGQDPDNFKNIPAHWGEYSRKYEWAKRAVAHDEANLPDFASYQVNAVLEYLRANAMGAAKALVKAFESERTRVPAANSVLNRVGVPESTEVSVIGAVSFTSDDMAAAKQKVDEWKKNRSG